MKLLLCVCLFVASAQSDPISPSIPNFGSIPGLEGLNLTNISSTILKALPDCYLETIFQALSEINNVINGLDQIQSDTIDNLLTNLLSSLEQQGISLEDPCVKDNINKIKDLNKQFKDCFNKLTNLNGLFKTAIGNVKTLLQEIIKLNTQIPKCGTMCLLKELTKSVIPLINPITSSLTSCTSALDVKCTVSQLTDILNQVLNIGQTIQNCIKGTND